MDRSSSLPLHRRFTPKVNLLLAILCSVALFTPSSHAAAISGTLVVAGVGPVQLSSGVIDFTPAIDPAGNGTGLFDIVGGSTGSFLPLVGSTASIRDLNSGTVPVGAAVSYANFVTFGAQPNWSITLTSASMSITNIGTGQVPEPGTLGTALVASLLITCSVAHRKFRS